MKRLLQLFLGFFPKPIPIGKLAFDQFCSYVLNLYGIPDLPSYRLAMATMTMHLGPQVFAKSPFWFFKSIRSAQTKEVAYQIIADDREQRNLEERKLKQAAAEKLAALQPAVTAPQAGTANAPQNPQ
jgi:hypothetical protein